MGKAMKRAGHRAKVFSDYLHGVLAHLPHPLAERENLLNGKDVPSPRAQARNELKRERRDQQPWRWKAKPASVSMALKIRRAKSDALTRITWRGSLAVMP
jgi:hypothetical protein